MLILFTKVAKQNKKLNLVDFILDLDEKLVEKVGTEFSAEQDSQQP